MHASVVPIPMELHLPAGAFGPEPVTVDVRAYLVRHGNGLILLDTGMDPTGAALDRAVDAAGAAWSDLTHVVITHAHPDHVGALGHVRAVAPAAVVMAGPEDGVPDARPLADGDAVGSLRVVATPGHTPGHVSFVTDDGAVALVGDAVGSLHGRLTRGPAAFTADPAAAERSLRRLLDLGAARMVFGHGPEIEDPWSALGSLLDDSPG